jgi:chorismate mutase
MKRMADLGSFPMSTDLCDLRSRIVATLDKMADVVWSGDIFQPVPSGKDLDTILLKVQSEVSKNGLNNVWAEKARLIAKAAVVEQWKRGQRNLFGRFRNIATVGDVPMDDGSQRLVNLPEEFSRTLTTADAAALQDAASTLDFAATLKLFRDLADGDCGFQPHQAMALRAMADIVRTRFKRPVWKDDGVIQLHIDYRCLRGGKQVLEASLKDLDTGVKAGSARSAALPLTSVAPRGQGISVPLRLSRSVATKVGDDPDLRVAALAVELGPVTAQAKIVVTQPPKIAAVAGLTTVVAEDFGFRNTSSIAVLRSASPIGDAALLRVSGHNGGDEKKLTKTASKKFLTEHVSGDEVDLLELVQFDGKDFLDRIATQAKKVDGLRSEIDRLYNRLNRIRTEINRVAGAAVSALVPDAAVLPDHQRYMAMHGRFFRLLIAIGRLKEKRRAVYRAVAGLKKSWFGHVAQRKAELAEKYGAAVVSEDLDIVTIETDDPAYKGRTFNKMINNGSKGQYNLRSENTLKWRGIASVKVPSFYTSSTDWRDGTVDKAQRRGEVFKAASDGRKWDADLHAAEMIGRYLFLRSKQAIQAEALRAAA